MSSRLLLTKSLKFSANFTKIDNAAYIHLGCPHNVNLNLLSHNHLAKCRRNVIGPGLHVRHASSTPTSPQATAATQVLDPIPEPPSPLPEIADTVSKAFLNFYRGDNGLEPEAIMHTDKLTTKGTVHPPTAATPEIYRTAIEIWEDPGPSNGPYQSSSLDSSMSSVIQHNDILKASSDSEELAKENGVNFSSNSTSESSYKTIFDSLPDPPAIPQVDTSTLESLNGEPTFSSLGLGGWYPPGWIQYALEFLHVDCGLPWWGSVAVGTLVIRLLMFPVVVISQRNAAMLTNHLPEITLIQDKMTEARHRGDKMDAAKYSMELMQFMQQKNISPLKNIIPPLCQAPVFISMFMALRGMSNLPVESLKEGGILWFVDLTIPDQFYLLPLITSATLYGTIALGADGVSNTSNPSGVVMKYVLRAMPIIVFPFTVNFSGLLLVYWTTSNFFTLCQVGLLKIPRVRKLVGIPQKIKHPEAVIAPTKKGFIANVKNAWTNMKITSELEQRERADKMAFMQAGREPIKKTYKYDPTKLTPKQAPVGMMAKKRT